MADQRPNLITRPAVRIKGTVYPAPTPATDEGWTEMMHTDAVQEAVKAGVPQSDIEHAMTTDPGSMGFVTRSGGYLSRREAAAHVLKHNQFRIGNPQDAQLLKLKAKLQHQLQSGHPETSLDSFDIHFAKSQAFRALLQRLQSR